MNHAYLKLLGLGVLGVIFAAASFPNNDLSKGMNESGSAPSQSYSGFVADAISATYTPKASDPVNNVFFSSEQENLVVLSDGRDLVGIHDSHVIWIRKAFREQCPIVDMQSIGNKLLIADSSGTCHICDMTTGQAEETFTFPQPIRMLTKGVLFNGSYWNTSYLPPMLLKIDLLTSKTAIKAIPADGQLSNVVTSCKTLFVSDKNSVYEIDMKSMQISKKKTVNQEIVASLPAFLNSTDKILSRADGQFITSLRGVDLAVLSQSPCRTFGLSSPTICESGSLAVAADDKADKSRLLKWCPLSGVGWQVPYDGQTYEQTACIANGFSVSIERNDEKVDHWYLRFRRLLDGSIANSYLLPLDDSPACLSAPSVRGNRITIVTADGHCVEVQGKWVSSE